MKLILGLIAIVILYSQYKNSTTTKLGGKVLLKKHGVMGVRKINALERDAKGKLNKILTGKLENITFLGTSSEYKCIKDFRYKVIEVCYKFKGHQHNLFEEFSVLIQATNIKNNIDDFYFAELRVYNSLGDTEKLFDKDDTSLLILPNEEYGSVLNEVRRVYNNSPYKYLYAKINGIVDF